ncbi:NXPE family member 4-like isoform X2 [Clavelina lepadiformis]|uniref:NXPE family member 4-like isoform X2 n=1 Tax=Clavelina lepadiformis TaxID=159417 RepID=UPI004042441F
MVYKGNAYMPQRWKKLKILLFLCLVILTCVVVLAYMKKTEARFPFNKVHLAVEEQEQDEFINNNMTKEQDEFINNNINEENESTMIKIQNFMKNFTLPKEALDPSTVWYGNIYKDIYGLPLSAYDMTSFEKIGEDWIQFFPDFLASRQHYHLRNPSHDPDAFTRITSKVSLKKRSKYVVGDVFVAHIQARDQLMRNKTFGGDYFRARLIRTRFGEAVDGIPCAIYDHANGTYTVKAPLLMSGDFTLEVKLLLSVEGIDHWINFTEKAVHKRACHHAILKSDEKVVCGLHLDIFDNSEDLCDYSNPRNKEPWFCVRPPSGVCHPIVEHVIEKLPDKPPHEISRETKLKFGRFGEIFGSGSRIRVSSTNYLMSSAQLLSAIRYGMEYQGIVVPAGFLHNGHWVSLQHKSAEVSVASSRDCFRNKIVFLLGDSTMRQFFFVAVHKFNLTQTGPDNRINKHAPQLGRSERDNITVYYRTHGMPVEVPGLISTRPYISDTIDTLMVGGPDVYVILNIGVHFIHYDASYYIHRLMGIKKAILNHLKIHPETRFIVRGQNVVECAQEWALFRFEILLRNVFKDMKEIVVLNLWDFTIVWRLYDYHPGDVPLDEEARLMFSYLCNWNP